MIGIVRRILGAIMLQVQNRAITHEVLTTFLAEVCAIVNARPLTTVPTDPDSPQLLSPPMLLTQKTTAVDLNSTDEQDLLRGQWQHVQALASMFWKKWRMDYLASLQGRRKWNDQQRNVKQGDIVLLKDKDLQHSDWPMGSISKARPSTDELVRQVEVRIWRNGQHHTYTRPITDIVVLVENRLQTVFIHQHWAIQKQ